MRVLKRSGKEEKFDIKKIQLAVIKSMLATKSGSTDEAILVADEVKKELSGDIVSVEDIQDLVVSKLKEPVKTAYIEYRNYRKTVRDVKKALGLESKLKLTSNALLTLEARYLLKNKSGKVVETPEQLFHRVARYVGIVELYYEYVNQDKISGGMKSVYGSLNEKEKKILKRVIKRNGNKVSLSELIRFAKTVPTRVKYFQSEFEDLMKSLKFLPNSPTLMNAGTDLGQLSACFVIPVEDSMESIFEAVKHQALIHKTGGGTGFSFSKLRGKNSGVASTQGVASGVVSFMEVFDKVTDVVKQGGKRRGANMGILSYNHPDIIEFIESKDNGNSRLSNFNISVGVDKEFFDLYEQDGNVELINPSDGEVVGEISARELMDRIVKHAWETGDPGMVFLDEINENNPVKHIADIEATNPCAEEPLLPYESCNLGSIDVSKYVVGGKLDWEMLESDIKLAVRFLDDVVDANNYPIEEIEKMTLGTRRIGLGYMGVADMFIKLGIPYQSVEAIHKSEEIMKFLLETAQATSVSLGEEKGVYPYSRESKMRNITTTTIAPTGTISIIAGCSSSIEPLFALAYKRNVLNGKVLTEFNPLLKEYLISNGLFTKEIENQIIQDGTLANVDLPENVKELFKTSLEIDYSYHIMIQSTFQKYCEAGVSKTINMKNSATEEDVLSAYLLARQLHCKGITVFRDGSKTEQVLVVGEKKPVFLLNSDSEFSIENPYCRSGKCD